jgi:hypothetical protein
MYLMKSLRELLAVPGDKLIDQRYDRFRRLGQFLEGDQPDAGAGSETDRVSA